MIVDFLDTEPVSTLAPLRRADTLERHPVRHRCYT